MKWTLFILLIFLVAPEESYQWKFPAERDPSAVVMVNESSDVLFAPVMVNRFYANRSGSPAWTQNGELNLQGHSLIQALRHTFALGLIPDEYHLSAIDSLIWEAQNTGAVTQLDAQLTDALFKLLTHLRHGRLEPHSAVTRAKVNSVDTVMIASVEQAIFNDSIVSLIRQFDCTESEYVALREALARGFEQYQAYGAGYSELRTRSQELKKIAINMERWRWEEPEISGRYLLVNIPSFKFYLMENGRHVLESRVIVGRPDKQTPELASAIECIVIYPYWNVPRNIAVKELLPIIQADTGYLTRNHFDVLDTKGHLLNHGRIDWKAFSDDYFPFRLRQRDGEDNALGLIKFHFDNPYGVYLHDTNARYLFKRQMRALSHGCIRAEKSLELARYLVELNQGIYTPDMLDEFISRHKRVDIPLHNPLPIHIRYFTAGSDGIYKDIYGRDAEMMRAFERLAQPSDPPQPFYTRQYARR